jgi:hypothetical protein
MVIRRSESLEEALSREDPSCEDRKADETERTRHSAKGPFARHFDRAPPGGLRLRTVVPKKPVLTGAGFSYVVASAWGSGVKARTGFIIVSATSYCRYRIRMPELQKRFFVTFLCVRFT